jgi:predicted secreted hydrolase
VSIREARGERREAPWPSKRRRLFLQCLLTATVPGAAAQQPSDARLHPPSSRLTRYAPVLPGYRMRFPEDEGSHPDFRTEWWYVTGWLNRENGSAAGFQVTFFRTRPEIDESNPSAFTPRQIIIAHAALSDRSRRRLLHDQRLARAAFDLAGAAIGRTNVWIDEWSLVQHDTGYTTRVGAKDFALDLSFAPTQPPLLQGDGGYSRKGADPASASYYYSLPHLRVSGAIVESGKREEVTGSAWLDHEWSSSYMAQGAAGWDWIGINFDDGGALMAFRMRDAKGAKLWAGGAYRNAAGVRQAYTSEEIEFVALREWRSARTGAIYPVAWRVRAAALEITLEPLTDDQESDSRASVGTVYWEGAVRALRDGKVIGRGYLELTGYWRAMKL